MAMPVMDKFGRNNFISREPVLAGVGYSNIPLKQNIFSDSFINNSEYGLYSEGRAASQDDMSSNIESDSYRVGRRNIMFSGYAGTTGNTYSGVGFGGYSSGVSVGRASQKRNTGVNIPSSVGADSINKGNSVRTPDIGMNKGKVSPSVSLGDLSVDRARAVAVSEQRKKTVAKKRKAVRTVRRTSDRPFPFAFIVMAAMSTVLLMYIIYNLVSLNEMTIELAESQSMLTQLVNEEKELSLKLELKNDLLEIEKIATEEYGMVKNDKVVKQYINIEGEDKIEVNAEKSRASVEMQNSNEADHEENGVFSNVMSAFAKRFEKLLEAIN